jgi:hypothetical protein
MENKIFDDFLEETIEGFTLSDCKSFVLSTMVINKLREKTLDEAILIFQSFPKRFKNHLMSFLTDIFIEEVLTQN